MKIRVVVCAALLGLVLSPAPAAITVSLSPASIEVLTIGGTAVFEAYADIPESDAIVGFGFDPGIAGPGVAFDSFAPAAPFDPVGTTPDGDGIAGLTFPGPVWGAGVHLGTLTFHRSGWLPVGGTPILLGDSYPVDLSEGFALATPGAFADVTYIGGLITPEPTALVLLALGGLALLRRR